MNVLLINTFDKGGAATACMRLHAGLLSLGQDTRILFKKRENRQIQNSSVFSLPKRSRFTRVEHQVKNYFLRKNGSLRRRTNQMAFRKARAPQLEKFSFPFSEIDITENEAYRQADIVNLHWVADFLDFTTFFRKNSKTVVWTLHDANPFLGGEHYPERYSAMGDSGYPILRKYSEKELEVEEQIIELKARALEGVENLHIVCPSVWLKNESERSRLFSRYPHYHIPYGFPLDIFKPLNRKFCRELLGIPKERFVILFVSDSLLNFRKGYGFLKKSLDSLSKEYEDKMFLCAIGAGKPAETRENIRELGAIFDERLMAAAYSAADVFVIPSLEDNLPNTMIESLLCGTPVIGFSTGGIPETIVQNLNGYVCPELSVDSLSETIEACLMNQNAFDRTSISDSAAERFGLDKQAGEYLSLFNLISKG